jgi:hypothetical protein
MLYRHCFSTSLCQYAIKKVQENMAGMKLNGTHKLLVYADGVNLLGYNIVTIKKNTEALTNASDFQNIIIIS